MQKLVIPEEEAGQRLDKFLSKYLSLAPKSFLYKMIRKKNIVCNGKRTEPGALLSDGDELSLFLSDETIVSFRRIGTARGGQGTKENGQKVKDSAQKMKENARKKSRKAAVPILYEDSALLIAAKPAGMLSQKSAPSDFSVNEYLRAYTEKEAGQAETYRPSICNRLDRNTSGLITFAKTYAAARALSALFASRSLHKYYLALVWGRVTEPAHLRAYLKKDTAQNRVEISETESAGAEPIEMAYEPIEVFEDAALLRLLLITGKSHQLRAHLAYLGHPIIGDPKYGGAAGRKGHGRKAEQPPLKAFAERQLLHAAELCFPKPLPKPLSALSGRSIKAPLPADFLRALSALRSEERA